MDHEYLEYNNKYKRKSEMLTESPPTEETHHDDQIMNKKLRIEVKNIEGNVQMMDRYKFGSNLGFIKLKKERNDKYLSEMREEIIADEIMNDEKEEKREYEGEDKVTEIDLASNPLFMKSNESLLNNILLLKNDLEIHSFNKLSEMVKSSLENLTKYKSEIEEIENEEQKKLTSSTPILERSGSLKKLENIYYLNEEERVLLSILFSHQEFSLEIWNKMNSSLCSKNKEKLKNYGYFIGMLHRILKKNFNKYKGLAFKWGENKKKGPYALLEDSKEDFPKGEQKDYSETIMSNSFHLCSQDPRKCVPESIFDTKQNELFGDRESGVLYVFQCQNSLLSNIKKNKLAMKVSPNFLGENDIIIPPKTEFKLLHSNGDSNLEFRQLLELIFQALLILLSLAQI